MLGLPEGLASGEGVTVISTWAVGVGVGVGLSFLPLPK